LRDTVNDLDARLFSSQDRATRIRQQLEDELADVESLTAGDFGAAIEDLKKQISDLEQQKRQIEQAIKAKGENVREFTGEGRRAYLTGLRLGEQRTLILLDTSASMLAETLVNVLRFRNLHDEAKRLAPKWQQAVKTVDWLTARFAPDTQFQIYLFGTTARPALPGSEGIWLNVSDTEATEKTIEVVNETLPEGGTSLLAAFSAIGHLNPRPDNVILITDGLPTQGGGSSGAAVSGRDREKLFRDALGVIPDKIPINVILLPMEGDPAAAGSFWRLAQLTAGSMITPTPDWP
jgi:hypothetical protein